MISNYLHFLIRPTNNGKINYGTVFRVAQELCRASFNASSNQITEQRYNQILKMKASWETKLKAYSYHFWNFAIVHNISIMKKLSQNDVNNEPDQIETTPTPYENQEPKSGEFSLKEKTCKEQQQVVDHQQK